MDPGLHAGFIGMPCLLERRKSDALDSDGIHASSMTREERDNVDHRAWIAKNT